MRWDDRLKRGMLGLAGLAMAVLGAPATPAAQVVGTSAVVAEPAEAADLDAAAVEAYSTLDWPLGVHELYPLDSGLVHNKADGWSVAYQATVFVKDSVWVRLYFGDVALEDGSFVRMTAAFDNEVQELDAAGLAMWNYTSAYFNGDTVQVELITAPGARGNRLVLEEVGVHRVQGGIAGPCADDDCGICSTDDRVLSNENWSGRLMPVGCTGSVYNTDSCVVSAGHCADGNYDDVIQFNVPASSASCYPANPPVADQFPITAHQFVNGGVGNDWSVMTTGTNSLGQKPYDRYGVYMPISAVLASSGNTVAVWGYGVDNGQPTRSQDQQTSSGTVGTRYSTYYTYSVDVTYGNSGSGLIYNNAIVGIVTHCSFSCANIATRVDLAAFAAARDSLCGGGTAYCSASSSSTAYEYISNVTVGSINNSSGSSGYANYTALSTNMSIGTGYAITLTIGTPYSSDIGGCWADWNQDEDFSDTGETITTSWSGTGPYSTTITPPAGATPGSTRLRVRIQDGGYNPTLSPCGTTSYGEVEDYSVYVTQPTDTTPPTPNPMTFAGPLDPGTTSIDMTATLATDAESPPVWYEFDFVSGGTGGTDSGTQSSRDYTDDGLQPNTQYTYRVRARDTATTPNYTSWSSNATVATWALVPAAPTLSNPTTSTMDLNVNPNGNPSNTVFAVQCTASSPNDSDWTGKYVNASGQPSTTAVWQTDSQWATITVQGLNSSTQYTFAVKARNLDGVETALGPTASLSTTSGGVVQGDMNCDGLYNAGDIPAFVLALTDRPAYEAQYPGCDADAHGDFDGDDMLTAGDIPGFVAGLTGG